MKIRILGCIMILAAMLSACNDKASNDTTETSIELAKDAHSFANFNDARLNHISLDLLADFGTKTLSGSAKIFFENRTKTDQLVLDTRNLSINEIILDNGNKAEYTLSDFDSIFGKALTVSILPETKWVSINYTTDPKSKALQWLKPEQTRGKEHPFLFSQSQAILARSWVPCQDGPGVKFTYDAKITTDKNLMAIMSASNGTEKSADGVYNFTMDQPISSYLLAIAIGDLEFRSTGRNSGVYAEPSFVEACVNEFSSMQSMIDSAEQLYGEYVWGRYDVVVLPPSFPFGGMENPRLTFATPTIIAGDGSLVSLIAHELAHSWSGNLVTNETWNDFWLNEGFTVYFEQRIMEKVYGKEYEEMLTKLGMGELMLTLEDLTERGLEKETHLYLELDGRDPDDGLTDVAYEKGRFFLQTVEATVGRERFDSFLNQYFTTYAFKPMNTKRFIAYLESELLTEEEKGRLNSDAWVYGPGLPDNAPEPRSVELDKVELAISRFNSGRITASEIDTSGYTTHHWLYFLRGLKNLEFHQMDDLDGNFAFTKTGNSEIACDWFKHCIDANYQHAFPAMKAFLVRVGRRKFLAPLYSKLAETDEHKEWARAVYEEARPGYHSVSYNTIDDILK